MTHGALKPRIAIVDDDRLVVNMFAAQFSDEFEILKITQPATALDVIDDSVMVAIVDERMDGIAGTDVLALLREQRPLVTRILLTAHASLECLSKAINEAEVRHFIDKRRGTSRDWDAYMRGVLRDAVAASRSRNREETRRDLMTASAASGFSHLVGRSSSLSQVVSVAKRIANSEIPVLIQGETGTGKELMARAIHFEGARSRNVFLALNCANFDRELVASELFGHTKGAFTGAHSDKKGYLELADAGTIFLDEIGDMPLEVQANLNRFLDDGEFRRLGEPTTKPRYSNVRIIAATHMDLMEAIRQKRFREDLYFRLSSCCLRLPPLRERVGDIPLVAGHLLARACARNHRPPVRLTDSAVRLLESYHFPGNVRELRAIIELALILSPGGTKELEVKHFNIQSGDVGLHKTPRPDSPAASLAELEENFSRETILKRLRHFGGHQGQTAASLRIDPRTLYNRMRDLNVHWPESGS